MRTPFPQKIILFHLPTFFSAFLLFQIELIIAKTLLPVYGGAYTVWGACLVFFQATLLLGYFYAHTILKRLPVIKYRHFHALLVLLPLLFFPGRDLAIRGFSLRIPLVINVFWQLVTSIGIVFFVLSTSSLIYQKWLSASLLPERSNPYALYATSNAGSFAALLSYPFIFEMYFTLNAQVIIWRWAYLVFALTNLLLVACVPLLSSQDTHPSSAAAVPPVAKEKKTVWLIIGAGTTMMFMAVTNILTYEISPMPLLWVAPLGIYLLSFVLVFKKKTWYPDWIQKYFHLFTGIYVTLFFLIQQSYIPFPLATLGCLTCLFVICLYSNHVLYVEKPQDDGNLTKFYLYIALGGFIGGMVTSWLMPLSFPVTLEYIIALLLVFFALSIRSKQQASLSMLRSIFYLLVFLAAWNRLFRSGGYHLLGFATLAAVICLTFAQLRKYPKYLLLAMTALLFIIFPYPTKLSREIAIRNYYGIHRVRNQNNLRLLTSGTTIQGGQFLADEKRLEPTTYYYKGSPMYQIMSTPYFHFKKIGAIGLGTGTLAAFASKDTRIDFFEIDPDIEMIARNLFTFLRESKGEVRVLIGDARMTLKEAPKSYYDLLMSDAFSADVIPAHLLTTEAIAEYKTHLTKNGIILFHISNRFFSLEPLLAANAVKLDALACMRHVQETKKDNEFPSLCVIYTWDKDVFATLTQQLGWLPLLAENKAAAWTDQYSNLLPLVKPEGILDPIRYFKPFYWKTKRERDTYAYKQALLEQGKEQYRKKDFNAAIETFNKLQSKYPSATVELFIGCCYLQNGDPAKAIAIFEKLAETDESDIPLNTLLDQVRKRRR